MNLSPSVKAHLISAVRTFLAVFAAAVVSILGPIMATLQTGQFPTSSAIYAALFALGSAAINAIFKAAYENVTISWVPSATVPAILTDPVPPADVPTPPQPNPLTTNAV